MLLNVTALATIESLALIAIPYPLAAVLIVEVVKTPLNATVPVVFVRTIELELTEPPKVAPPELVTVTLPISVPIAPVMFTAPVVLITILEASPPDVPVIEATVILPELPPPKYKVTPLPKRTLLSVMGDVPKSNTLFELKNVVVPPKLKEQLVPTTQVDGLAAVNSPKRMLSPVL